MVFSRKTYAHILVLALGAWTGACGDGDGSGSPADGAAGGSVDGGSSAGSTGMISASKGGHVTEGSVSVDIPAGALSKDTKITANVVDSSKLPGAKLLVGDVYDLGPNGTKFLKPVTLTFDLVGAKFAEDEEPAIAYLAQDSWELLEDSAVKNGKVTATTTHFTFFGVVRHRAAAPMRTADAGPDSGSGNPGVAGSATCNGAGTDANHQCYEYHSPIPANIEMFKTQCADIIKGMLVTTCPSDKVGGCKVDEGGGTYSITWMYAMDPSEINCGKSGTVVSP